MVTLHEFSGLSGDTLKMEALQYMHAADHVVFTTPHEQRAVAEYLPEVLNKSSVIPAFQATPPVAINRKDPSMIWRPNNIMVFGYIRSGKGYDQVLELTRLIRDDPDLATLRKRNPTKNAHEIMLVGSVVNENYLGSLVRAIYGLSPEEMPVMTGKHAVDRTAILHKLDELEKSGAKKALPIELYLDVSRENLPALFERANFAYQPVERGATHHSSAIPAAMASGCITITTKGKETPEALKNGAVLFAQNAQEALDIFKQRLDATRLNAETRKKSLAYADSVSPESAAIKYASLYNALAKTRSHATPSESWKERLRPAFLFGNPIQASL